MTNKEAIEILKPLFEQCKGTNECLGYIEHYFSKDEELALDLAIQALEERPQGECRTCRHRDPEDKKCDCGGMERQGCLFPVSDDYFCKFYEKGGVE